MKTLNYSILPFQFSFLKNYILLLVCLIILPFSLFSQSFAPAITGPFGLPDSLGSPYWHSLSDIDGDGDNDYFHFNQGHDGGAMVFFENTGNINTPQFDGDMPVYEPFGIIKTGTPGAQYFADMDNDGDLDFWWSAQFNGPTAGGFFYYQNFGTATDPVFDDPVYNPFGLVASGKRDFLTIVDIDDDKDYDLVSSTEDNLIYLFENTGTPEAPQFAAPITNDAIGLPNFVDLDGSNRVYLAFGDIDLDEDQDLLAFTNIFFSGPVDTMSRAYLIENIGTKEVYDFAAPIESPFNIDISKYVVAIPQLADMDADGDLDLFFEAITQDLPNRTIFYSENLLIVSNTKEESLNVDLKLSPNPARDFISLEINSIEHHKNLSYEIYGIFGKSYQKGKLDIPGKQWQKTLNVGDLHRGIYFVKITSGKQSKVVKFEKL